VGKQAFDKKLEAIESLREPEPLRKALKDRNNFLVSKAAAIAARAGLKELAPDLAAAFDRFMIDPVKSDPKCWAKIAIAQALKDLDSDDASLFIRGLKHIQMEPSYIRPEDTAVKLRGTCAMALVGCALPRYEILLHLVDSLGADPDRTVRMDAARAIAQIPGQDSLLLLRLKALSKDEPEVIGQCFVSLLEISPAEQLPFVARFLDSDMDTAVEAVAALGECHDAEAAPLLIKKHQNSAHSDLKRAIVLSLGASRHNAAADYLLTLVSSDPAAIRALAAGRFRDEYRDRVRAAIDDPKQMAIFESEFNPRAARS